MFVEVMSRPVRTFISRKQEVAVRKSLNTERIINVPRSSSVDDDIRGASLFNKARKEDKDIQEAALALFFLGQDLGLGDTTKEEEEEEKQEEGEEEKEEDEKDEIMVNQIARDTLEVEVDEEVQTDVLESSQVNRTMHLVILEQRILFMFPMR